MSNSRVDGRRSGERKDEENQWRGDPKATKLTSRNSAEIKEVAPKRPKSTEKGKAGQKFIWGCQDLYPTNLGGKIAKRLCTPAGTSRTEVMWGI